MKNLEKTIHKLLDEPFWPEEIKPMVAYGRTHDDCDGDLNQQLTVMFSGDGGCMGPYRSKASTCNVEIQNVHRRGNERQSAECSVDSCDGD